MLGFHWRIALLRRHPYVNIPYWPHRILVIGLGRLGKDAIFREWGICCYRMHMDFCCKRRSRRVEEVTLSGAYL